MGRPPEFGRYTLVEAIKSGGYGEIHKAKGVPPVAGGVRPTRAIKILLDQPDEQEGHKAITMLLDEAKIMVQLLHPNIGQVLELGQHEGVYFIAMEYIAGRDLFALINKCRGTKEATLPLALSVHCAMEICKGLHYAHTKRDRRSGLPLQIVHRDLTPRNIMVSFGGEVKIVDFGVAKATCQSETTEPGVIRGKPSYCSPEQVRGQAIDSRSDLFAFGSLFHELLTGNRLFETENHIDTLIMIRDAEVLPPSAFNEEVQPELDKIVMKALQKQVVWRYQSALEVYHDLAAFAQAAQLTCTRENLRAWMQAQYAPQIAEEAQREEEWRLQNPENKFS